MLVHEGICHFTMNSGRAFTMIKVCWARACRSGGVAALALGLAGIFPMPAHAVTYDEILVKNALGLTIASVKATPAELTDPNAMFFVPGILVDINQYGNFSDVIEGGVPVELFGIGYGPDGYDLAFALQGVASANFVQNGVAGTGTPIDMTMYLDPALRKFGYKATFGVSRPDVAAVPEPLTWMMVIVGFAAIGARLRRRSGVMRTA